LTPAKYLVPYILITAFTYVFAKDGLNYASPFVYGLLVALLTFFPLFAVSRGKLTVNRDTLLFGLFYWLSGATWLLGLNLIAASQSAILSFTMPLFAIPLSVYLLGERASRVEAYGAALGFAGIVLYNLPLLGGTVTIIGAGLTLVDAFFWALSSVYLGKLRGQDSPQTLATGSLLGIVLYGAFSFADFSVRPTLELATDAAYNGAIAGALCIFLWMALVKTEKLARLTTLIFIAPIVTLVYGVATTGIIPSFLTLGGVALIFVGIYATSILAARAKASAPPTVTSPVVEHDS
jgi:drug/metabolite transporter (DMT)-like permease